MWLSKLVGFDVLTVFLLTITASALYLVVLSIHRLYFSSLKDFPGPKLAAITYFYEFYWDVIKPGRFCWHLQDLHKKYGPIIRISPDEVHILDSAFFDEFYARPTSTSRRHKAPHFSGRFGFRGDSFSTWHHDVHKMRRAAINPYFSAKRINELQPVIREKLKKFAQRLVKSYEIGSVVPINLGYMALTGDITTEYAFASSYNQLDSPGFTTTYDECLKALYSLGNFAVHFPWIHTILDHTPRWVTAAMNPVVLPIIDFYSDSTREVSDIRRGINEGHKIAKTQTIFHEMLASSALPEHEKSDKRLGDEAVEIVAAGIVTSSFALSVGTYHILANPSIQAALRSELQTHFPTGLNLDNLELNKAQLNWHSLESLPYLSGCIRESIRLSGGVVSRSPRIAPDEDIRYASHVIPRGTIINMTSWHVSHDPAIFPDPEEFRPERWITDASGKPTRNLAMERWLVAFGKGTRQCAGINLAFAELYLTFAMVFRGFEFDLFETGYQDIEVVHEYMVPYPRLDSKGVRVKVKDVVI